MARKGLIEVVPQVDRQCAAQARSRGNVPEGERALSIVDGFHHVALSVVRNKRKKTTGPFLQHLPNVQAQAVIFN